MSGTYKILSPIREVLSSLYSLGAMSDCKRTVIDLLEPGDTVFFLGANADDEIIEACLKGAVVTVVEGTRPMADRLAAKLRYSLANSKMITDAYDVGSVEIRLKDALKHKGEYDYVVANFSLNMYDEITMVRMLEHLTTLVKDDGQLVIGDFKYPRGNILSYALQSLYWFIANIFFVAFSSNKLHQVHEYDQHLYDAGFIEQHVYFHDIFGVGYETIVANKRPLVNKDGAKKWSSEEFKDFIKERDGYRCLNPFCFGNIHKLCVHHINYNKKDCVPENLITLCTSCNSRANKNRKWHEAWYKAIINRRYGNGSSHSNVSL